MCFSRRRLHFVLAALLVRGLLLDSGSISSRPTASAQTLAEESDAEYQSESDREPAATPAPKKKASASQAGKWRSPGASISKNSLSKPGVGHRTTKSRIGRPSLIDLENSLRGNGLDLDLEIRPVQL